MACQHLLQDPISDTGGMGKKASHWSGEEEVARRGKGVVGTKRRGRGSEGDGRERERERGGEERE